tara:strand:+ start:244 stop:519 length:276 start_codon:yes stop_codon:yes gene_type:complete
MTRNLVIAFFLWLLLWALLPVAALSIVKFVVLGSLFIIPGWGLIWVCMELLPKRFKEVGTALACIFLVPIPGIKLVGIVEPWFDELIRNAQ